MGLKDLINKLRKQKLDQDIAAAEAANVLPAPTPSTSVTPQAYLNRTVAAVKKVNEVKANGNLKVMSENDALVDLSTMDGSTSAKALVTRNRADAVAQYWANQVGNTKQATLTKTITLHWDDGTTTDVKVG